MRNEKYSRFLSRMKALCGVENLLTVEETQFLEYFQRNIRYAWELYEWPEVCPIKEFTPDADGVVAYDGNGVQDIGEVLAAWDGDPDSQTGAREIGYTLTTDGVKFIPQTDSSVWIHFRSRIPDYYGDAYDNATAYDPEDQAYYGGRFYKCLVASTGNLPTDASYWEELEIPYSLFEFVVQASFADSLMAEGFSEKAGQERGRAEGLIVNEIEKVERQQRQRRRASVVRTHGTSQLRNY